MLFSPRKRKTFLVCLLVKVRGSEQNKKKRRILRLVCVCVTLWASQNSRSGPIIYLLEHSLCRAYLFWSVLIILFSDVNFTSFFLLLFFSSPIRYAHQHHTSITVVATTTPNPIWFAADWTSETTLIWMFQHNALSIS